MKKEILTFGIVTLFFVMIFIPIISSVETSLYMDEKENITKNRKDGKYLCFHIWGAIRFCEKDDYNTIIQKEVINPSDDGEDEYNGIWTNMNFEGTVWSLEFKSLLNPFRRDTIENGEIELKISIFRGYMDYDEQDNSYFLMGNGLILDYN